VRCHVCTDFLPRVESRRSRWVYDTCDVQRPRFCQSDDFNIVSRDGHDHHHQVYMSGGVLEVFDNVVFEANSAEGAGGMGGAVSLPMEIGCHVAAGVL